MILIIALFSHTIGLYKNYNLGYFEMFNMDKKEMAGVRKEVGFEDAPNLINISRSMIVIFF